MGSQRWVTYTIALFYLLTVFIACKAQQLPLYSQYSLHTTIYNPSYAGSTKSIRAGLFIRKQWTNMPGAPFSSVFVIDMPINYNRMGLGIRASQESIFIKDHKTLHGLYAYKVNLGHGKLSFGAMVGMSNTIHNLSALSVKDIDDKLLQNNYSNKLHPDAVFGIGYTSGKLEIGLSVWNVLRFSSGNMVSERSASYLTRTYVGTAKYLITFSDYSSVEFGGFMYFIPNVSTPLAMASLSYLYRDEAAVGMVIKPHSLGVIAQLKMDRISHVLENIKLGYGYDIPLLSPTSLFIHTHEISISMRIDKPKSIQKTKNQPVELSPYDL